MKSHAQQNRHHMRGIQGIGALICALFFLWLLIWQVTPILVENIPALAHYGKVAKENDIMPGVLYYNDVPVTVDSERNNRDTVRFLPHGGK